MIRVLLAFAVIVFALIFSGCKKSDTQSETILFGTWVKGANPGDTLQFMRKNNKNILRYNMSFSAALTAFTEVEFRYGMEN